MSEIKRRLRVLEQATGGGENIPVEQRWWLALAETPEAREAMAREHVTRADVERDWWAAAAGAAGIGGEQRPEVVIVRVQPGLIEALTDGEIARAYPGVRIVLPDNGRGDAWPGV